jgi:RNA polymerase sigma-70 factor (ECF subfamily)
MRWEDIVDRHGPLVWRCAYRLLGNDADAADCYQEAFAAALAVARREAVRNWPALLRRIVTTHALDRLRQRAIRGAIVPIAADVDVDSAAGSRVAEPSRVAEGRELLDAVRAALAQLPERHAEAFTLTCVEGMSYDEAAAVLGISKNNVGVLLHRARARLRELLAPVVDAGEARNASC